MAEKDCFCMRAFYESVERINRLRDLLLDKHIRSVEPEWVKDAAEEDKASLETLEKECGVRLPKTREKMNDVIKHISEGEYTIASLAASGAKEKLLECL